MILVNDEIDFDSYPKRKTKNVKSIKTLELSFIWLINWYLSSKSNAKLNALNDLVASEEKISSGSELNRLYNASAAFIELFYDYEYLIEDYKRVYHGYSHSKSSESDINYIKERLLNMVENIRPKFDIVEIIDAPKFLKNLNILSSSHPLSYYRNEIEKHKIDSNYIVDYFQELLSEAEVSTIHTNYRIIGPIANILTDNDSESFYDSLYFDTLSSIASWGKNKEIYENFYEKEFSNVIYLSDPNKTLDLLKKLSGCFIKLMLINEIEESFKTSNFYKPIIGYESANEAVESYRNTAVLKYSAKIQTKADLARSIHATSYPIDKNYLSQFKFSTISRTVYRVFDEEDYETPLSNDMHFLNSIKINN